MEYLKGNKIKPSGWILQQLKIQSEGLSGNLDKMWPDIKDSAWIGGSRNDWERTPYWLDGFIPLAYLLEDADMIERAEKYVSSMLSYQDDDGWLCPCEKEKRAEYDVWAMFLVCKVLIQHYDITGKESSLNAVYRTMKCLYNMLEAKEYKLFNWCWARWFEAIVSLCRLYEIYKEEWIRELAKILRSQGLIYSKFSDWWKRPKNKWLYETHIVNDGMMLKSEALYCKLLGEPIGDEAEKIWQILEEYNGTAVGTFTGDECLSGTDNNRGTELCGVVELMYSCELLYEMTGETKWIDRLEKAAFNALPATISDDMWTHQYVQQVNQIACKKFDIYPIFRTVSCEAHLFGLEPNFGCCTANFNQGWPKFVRSGFLVDENSIICAMMLPLTLDTNIGGTDVKISCETEYPFRLSGKYTVKASKPVEFALKIRIPAWAKAVFVDGKRVKKSDYAVIERKWEGKTEITVEFKDEPHFVSRPKNLKAVQYGALVFALPIKAEYKMYEYERDGVERKFPYCDYELLPQSEWRYGFTDKNLEVCYGKGDKIPFSSKSPRITVKADLSPINWDFADGYDSVSAATPESNKPTGKSIKATLVPYGCAKLRMTEMPICKKEKK